ncbi:MAG: phenylalanine--tRNA ligase subunit alpha [Cytophagales bacterium]|nr:phenylalanine--tRNA ligase subunit alpha [Cytophagales bacterium]
MLEKVKAIKAEIENFNVKNQEALEAFRLQFISRKSVIAKLFAGLKDITPEKKREAGILLNNLKNTAQKKFKELTAQLNQTTKEVEACQEIEDLTLPPPADGIGALHPLTITQAKIVAIFKRIGFNVSEGPEIEDDWHNFTALNFPKHHPARAMQDTFFISQDPEIVLRTHTSSVQVRVMESQQPPIRTISPGRVFRNEAVSARTHCVFHQVEGLYIDTHVSFADLKETLFYFAREMFGQDTKTRFRASYFPFTEPSAEMDINCRICKGAGCNVCKYTGWVEIIGAGMVDPQVLENCNMDAQAYTGFAFGMGIERIAMLKYQINDLRLFTENDIQFLKQFVALDLSFPALARANKREKI